MKNTLTFVQGIGSEDTGQPQADAQYVGGASAVIQSGSPPANFGPGNKIGGSSARGGYDRHRRIDDANRRVTQVAQNTYRVQQRYGPRRPTPGIDASCLATSCNPLVLVFVILQQDKMYCLSAFALHHRHVFVIDIVFYSR